MSDPARSAPESCPCPAAWSRGTKTCRSPDLSPAGGRARLARNLIDPEPLGRNAAELTEAAAARGVPLRLFFARKANKALALVDEAIRLGLGVDVASENELRQVLDRGVPADDIVVTAAIKPRALLELCVEPARSGDRQRDELELLGEVASAPGEAARIAIRLAPTPQRAPRRPGSA